MLGHGTSHKSPTQNEKLNFTIQSPYTNRGSTLLANLKFFYSMQTRIVRRSGTSMTTRLEAKTPTPEILNTNTLDPNPQDYKKKTSSTSKPSAPKRNPNPKRYFTPEPQIDKPSTTSMGASCSPPRNTASSLTATRLFGK